MYPWHKLSLAIGAFLFCIMMGLDWNVWLSLAAAMFGGVVLSSLVYADELRARIEQRHTASQYKQK